LACLAPWGCERGWCGARGAGTARGGSGSSGEGGTPEGAPWRTAVATFGTAAAPSAAVLRGCCGSTHRCAAAPAGRARLVCGRGGCYARYGGRDRVAHALRGTREWYGYSGVRVVSRVGTRGRHRPIRTARRAPSRPSTRRSPSHRRPMVRGRGLRSAIARGGSGAAGGAGAVDAIRVGCRRSLGSNGLGGTLPPELGRLIDLVDL
jgi:hypothetical protein